MTSVAIGAKCLADESAARQFIGFSQLIIHGVPN